MPKQQRQVRMEPRGQMAAMQQLETRSDEELEGETRFRAAAQTILGVRAAERYDAKTARGHFQRAIAAARPQDRLQIRRTADAYLALAERRAGDFRKATERLGGEVPTTKQLRGLQFMGLVAPPKSAGTLARVRGVAIVITLIIVVYLLAMGIAEVLSLPFGGVSWQLDIFWGFVVFAVALAVLIVVGRRRQRAATAKRAEQVAARSR